MKKFFYKSSLFCLPLVLWVVVVVLVDPFNYFNLSPLFPDRVKKINAMPLNRLMYNMFEEARHPCENLVIGDSRSYELRIADIERVSGEKYFHLSSSAMKLNESVSLYYIAYRNKPLKKVYFTINYNMFNQFSYADRVTSVSSILANPLLYIFDRSVAQASYLVVRGYLQGAPALDSTPPMTREDFWELNIRVKANDYYGKYKYPTELYRSMEGMVEHARSHGVQIVFIIIPHHVEMQQRVEDYGLTVQMIRFKRDLYRLGVPVIDYDYPNDITSRQENFNDPIHYNEEVGKLIVREVWGGSLKYGKLLTPEYLDSLDSGKGEGDISKK